LVGCSPLARILLRCLGCLFSTLRAEWAIWALCAWGYPQGHARDPRVVSPRSGRPQRGTVVRFSLPSGRQGPPPHWPPIWPRQTQPGPSLIIWSIIRPRNGLLASAFLSFLWVSFTATGMPRAIWNLPRKKIHVRFFSETPPRTPSNGDCCLHHFTGC
jgi:hypothetical protein